MVVQRLIVAIFLIPLVAGSIYAGGWVFAGLITIALGIAAWEYWRMFTLGGFCPSRFITIGGVLVLCAARAIFGFADNNLLLAALFLITMAVHTFAYERGTDCAATSFAITISGVMYLGFIGAYLISLRNLPQGIWWTLTVIVAVTLADTGGFVFGRRFGKHKLSPRVSPKKSWEGYLGGILFAVVLTPVVAGLWHMVAPEVTALGGLILGGVISIVAPLGDLGESMLKREFGLKDTSNILPGHGGLMDRVDSWVWAAVIGYYLVQWIAAIK
jgi:phosphatidate cytidylyltransferase